MIALYTCQKCGFKKTREEGGGLFNTCDVQAHCDYAMLRTKMNLTVEAIQLYCRLKDYCKIHNAWAGTEEELASFTRLPYPLPPGVVHELSSTGLIKHHATNTYWLTVEI